MEYSDLLAKVLAAENLTVHRGKVSTASFDITNRILTLPMWEEMDDQLETMLILHEVGHALFTPARYVEIAKESRTMASAINIVEDPREERLMKERYPGSRKDFVAGYKIIRDKDIMGISDKDVNSMNLLDRINIFFKAGISSGVKFSMEEQQFVKRCQTIVTFEEAEQLARDIVDFIKEESKNQQKEEGTLKIKVSSFGEAEESDEQGSEWGDSEDGDSEDGDSNEYGESDGDFGADKPEEVVSQTMENLNQTLKDAAGTGDVRYIEISDDFGDRVVGYKTILQNCENFTELNYLFSPEYLKRTSEKFKNENKTQVSHLVAQFELRKAAQIYALRSIHKSGVLDTRKIAQYKVKEDIFRRNIKSPEGKNHGMILLLDWSQSMYSRGTIYHSLEQVMQLVMFCRSVGIPHHVYCFSDNVDAFQQKTVNNGSNFLSLLEIFSSDMSLKEFNEMVKYTTSKKILKAYPLGNTPLAPALAYMQKIIPEFKAAYKVDKLTLVTFTDGENTHRIISTNRGSSTYVSDKVTKKNYKLHSENSDNWRKSRTGEINILYRILRDRYDVTVTSFFASGTNLKQSLESSGVDVENMNNIMNLEKEYTKNGFVRVTGYGRDAIYVVKNTILSNEEFEYDVDPNASAAKIASSIKKASKTSVKGKILIEKIAETIS